MRYTELKQKEVVNIADGKRLGNILDLDIDTQSGQISAIYVPEPFTLSGLFRSKTEYSMIPWSCIRTVGEDIILVSFGSDLAELPGI